MTTRLTVDKAGRIILPKAVREELQLAPGDILEAETSGEQIMLRPVRGNAPLRKKHGVWVFSSGEPLPDETVRETLRQVRRERDEENLGRSR
ncbi:MAG: AbrB/MazE/SpoVT family DNA-binding domain-containing protein [Terriglobia bacterium]